MRDLIKKHINGNRSPVSSTTNSLTFDIVSALNGRVISCKSGDDVLTWTVPKYWQVLAAFVETLSGRKVIDFASNPLHLWTHSVSFDGIVTKQELEKHILFNKDKPDWIPYHYRNGYRYDAVEWGFCLSYNAWLNMNEAEYRVHIDSTLDTGGEMLVGDCHIKGQRDETIFFAAHSCHPATATDGLTNLAVIKALFERHLQNKKDLKYSYRFIIGPEYYAAAAYLQHASTKDIADLKCGMYLDMLGNNQPIALQSSFQADSILDKVAENVFKYHFKEYKKFYFRKLWGNDEIFYNSSPFRIPTICIGGEHHPEYHFSADNYDFINFEQLDDSVELLYRIIEVFETDFVPILQYKGPLYLSKYDLYIDPKSDRRGYELIDSIQILADGNRSCFDIAFQLDADYFFVRDFFDKLYSRDLISKEDKNIFI